MKKIVYSIALIVVLFGSCSDFIEPQSQSEFNPKTVEALDAMLLGAGYPARSGTLSYLTGMLRVLEDDIATPPPTDGLLNNYPPYIHQNYKSAYGLYTWQPDYDYIAASYSENSLKGVNLYESHYKYLIAPNLVFDYIDKVEGRKQDKDLLMAEAHTLRAYFYFQLANIYGAPYAKDKKALAVPLKLTGYISADPLSRHTVEEVYTQVLYDLHLAEEIFTRYDSPSGFKKNYRVNLLVVEQLLSRVYLYMERWSEAALYAKRVIDNNSGKVLLNMNSNPAPPSISYQKFIYSSYDNPETIWVFNSVSDTQLFFGTWALKYPDISNAVNFPSFVVSESLLNSFEEGDLRRKEYITVFDSKGKGNFNMPISKVAISSDGKDVSSEGNYYGQALRIAEAYLNYAEAKAWLYKTGGGTAQEALNILNMLRSNRFSSDKYVPLTTVDPDQLIKTVREERRRELCFEAHRWFDLRRYGMPEIIHTWVDEKGVHTYTLTEDDLGYTLPIPYPVIQANKKIIQNPMAPSRVN